MMLFVAEGKEIKATLILLSAYGYDAVRAIITIEDCCAASF